MNRIAPSTSEARLAVTRRLRGLLLGSVLLATVFVAGAPSAVSAETHAKSHGTITDRSIRWPTLAEWRRVVLLEDYNTRVVLLGTGLLGFAAGTVGSFTLLRKRALMGDALSHATLPGIGLAFVLTTLAGGDGKTLPVLLDRRHD